MAACRGCWARGGNELEVDEEATAGSAVGGQFTDGFVCVVKPMGKG
jgi:hypothetical protein